MAKIAAAELTQEQIAAIDNYGDNITTMKDFVSICRRRPGFLIGDIHENGYLNMMREIFQNSIDQLMDKESPCNEFSFFYDMRTLEVEVRDNGKGFPFDDMVRILTKEYIQTARFSFVGLNDKFNEDIKHFKIEDSDFNYADPKFSPLFADFEDFPPFLIQVGSNEILKSDSYNLYEKLIRDSVTVTLEEYEDAWHVFQMMPFKKALRAMDSISKFIDELIY